MATGFFASFCISLLFSYFYKAPQASQDQAGINNVSNETESSITPVPTVVELPPSPPAYCNVQVNTNYSETLYVESGVGTNNSLAVLIQIILY